MASRSGFAVEKAAVFALFLREIRTRFGKYRLGYLWALLEPATHVLILLAIRGFILGRVRPDISFTVFLIAGIVPWFLFRNISLRSLRAVNSNAGLFNYRAVKPIDTVIARALLEVMVNAVVFAGLLFLAWALLNEPIQINNFPYFAAIFLLIGWLAFGLGLIFMILGDAFPESEKIIPLFVRPLYFISGIFFSIHSVPPEYWPYLSWNPLLHAIELGRNAIFPTYSAQAVSLGYVFLCALVLNFVGLALYRYREKDMVST